MWLCAQGVQEAWRAPDLYHGSWGGAYLPARDTHAQPAMPMHAKWAVRQACARTIGLRTYRAEIQDAPAPIPAPWLAAQSPAGP